VTLAELTGGLTDVLIHGDASVRVEGLEYDSRKVVPGSAFVCVPGLKVDGHDFAARAVEKGAVALVVERLLDGFSVPQVVVPNARRALSLLAAEKLGRPADRLLMVGITGTNGKTTTSYLCEAVLRAKGKDPGLIGTIHAQIGGRAVPMANTTPESLDVQRLLAEMRTNGQNAAVMEVSSHALSLDRTYGLPCDVAVFTNLTQDHLDFHKDMEDYFQAKLKLFTGLNYQAGRPCPWAVINADDAYGPRILKALNVPYITYGLTANAHVRAEEIEMGPEGVTYTVSTPVGSQKVSLRMAGLFNVLNSLAAIGCGLALRIELADVVGAVESVSTVRGRFELVREGQDFAVVVDYAHTPDGLENVLRSAREITSGRVLTVFGCGGDRDRTKRPLMGEVAARLSDYVLVTSDNPRSESPRRILNDIQEGMPGATYEVLVDRAEAIYRAINLAAPGDTVVIAGKGHETYQLIGDQVLDFDDREVARTALRARRTRGKRRMPSWNERRRTASEPGAVVAGEP